MVYREMSYRNRVSERNENNIYLLIALLLNNLRNSPG